MATTLHQHERSVALEHISVPENVRELDAAHVEALAGSIALQGLLVPVVVRPAGEGFELVAGFHRIAAARSLGMTEMPVVVREAESEDADRAVENIARKALNPFEEATAVKAMLDRGLSEEGAGQALSWSRQRVSARVKILELPDRAQQLVGTGVIPLSAVDRLRAIGRVAPDLLEAVTAFIDDGHEWVAERLPREPGWVLDSAMRDGGIKTFAAYLDSVGPREIAELRLGKKAEEQLAEGEKLHKQIDRYAFGPPPIRFTEADVDQARAAGTLIEFDRGRPIIVDRSLYRELAKAALKRTIEELRTKVEAVTTEKKSRRTASRPDDPLGEARRQRDTQLSASADQAHGVNLDLGAGLLNGLSVVDPADMDVARFFVLGRYRPRTNYADFAAMPMRHRSAARRKARGRGNQPRGATCSCLSYVKGGSLFAGFSLCMA